MTIALKPLPANITTRDAAQLYVAAGLTPIMLHFAKRAGSGFRCSCPLDLDCATPGAHPRFNEWRSWPTTSLPFAWSKFPIANIALALDASPTSRLIAIRAASKNALEVIESTYNLKLPTTVTAIADRNGAVLMLLMVPVDVVMLTKRSLISIDANGIACARSADYIAVPPSRTRDGAWAWTTSTNIIEDAPVGLVELLSTLPDEDLSTQSTKKKTRKRSDRVNFRVGPKPPPKPRPIVAVPDRFVEIDEVGDISTAVEFLNDIASASTPSAIADNTDEE